MIPVATKAGMKVTRIREAPQRVRAGLSFALREATDETLCARPVETLNELATKILDVDKSILRSAVDHGLAHDWLPPVRQGAPLHFPARLLFRRMGSHRTAYLLGPRGFPP